MFAIVEPFFFMSFKTAISILFDLWKLEDFKILKFLLNGGVERYLPMDALIPISMDFEYFPPFFFLASG